MRYRFTRTAVPVKLDEARAFAAKITNYLNDTHGMTLEWGMTLFKDGRMFWTADYASLAEYEQTFAKIMGDEKYWEIASDASDLFVAGSLSDTLTVIM